MDKRVWYAVLMDNGDGPPVGMWNKEELAQLVCDKQPKGHRDIVIAVVPAAALAAATERAEAAERTPAHRRNSGADGEREPVNSRGDEMTDKRLGKIESVAFGRR